MSPTCRGELHYGAAVAASLRRSSCMTPLEAIKKSLEPNVHGIPSLPESRGHLVPATSLSPPTESYTTTFSNSPQQLRHSATRPCKLETLIHCCAYHICVMRVPSFSMPVFCKTLA